jgi:hypothetical protein
MVLIINLFSEILPEASQDKVDTQDIYRKILIIQFLPQIKIKSKFKMKFCFKIMNLLIRKI